LHLFQSGRLVEHLYRKVDSGNPQPVGEACPMPSRAAEDARVLELIGEVDPSA
jgi:hypothetical protein